LADPSRLRILALLRSMELSVGERLQQVSEGNGVHREQQI